MGKRECDSGCGSEDGVARGRGGVDSSVQVIKLPVKRVQFPGLMDPGPNPQIRMTPGKMNFLDRYMTQPMTLRVFDDEDVSLIL